MSGGRPVYGGGATQASSRTLATVITPCQSNAAAMRARRSPPAAMAVATSSTTTSARSAHGSWIASRGDGKPALMFLMEASVRSRCTRHKVSATGSCETSVSVKAVAGRWRIPVPRSRRASASLRLGQRNQTSGRERAKRQQGEQRQADSAAGRRQRQPEPGPRHDEEQPADRQQPRQRRPDALPGDRVLCALQRLLKLQPGKRIRGRVRLRRSGTAVQHRLHARPNQSLPRRRQ